MKNFCSYISIFILSFLIFAISVSAKVVIDDAGGSIGETTEVVDNSTQMNNLGFCAKASSVLQVVGYFILIVKIVIPLIIIILGSIDFGNAVLSGEDKAIKDSAMKLLKRFLIGLVIFLLPTIVRVIYFGVYNLKDKAEVRNESIVCIDCLTSPSTCEKTQREILK